MAQQPPPPPPPVKKSVAFLRWFGIFLFLCSLGLGIFGFIAKVELIPALIAFIVAVLGVPLSILQIDRDAFSFIRSDKKVGMQLLGTLLILFSIALSCYNFISLRSTPRLRDVPSMSTLKPMPRNTPPPTQVPITPTDTVSPTSSSILGNQSPIISDSLSSQDTLQWDMYPLDQAGACTFQNGTYHTIAIPGNSNSCLATQAKFQEVIALQADVKILRGDIGGIIFYSNVKQDSYYVFVMTTNGSYSLIKSFPSSDVQSYKPLTSGTSLYIKQGLNQLNTLTVIIHGNTFSLYVNTQYVGAISDKSYTSGFVGVFTNTDGEGIAEAAFTHFQVWGSKAVA